LAQIKAAIDTYRHIPERQAELIRMAMSLDAGWDASAGQYVDMYRYGLLIKIWQAERQKLIKKFSNSLKANKSLFSEFFIPGLQEYGDAYDWDLKEAL
jgi:hypothetical protein